MITVNQQSKFRFAGDPVLLTVDDSFEYDRMRGVAVNMSKGGKDVSLRVFPQSAVNISDLVDSMVDYFPNPDDDAGIFTKIIDGWSDYTFCVTQEDEQIDEFIAIPGKTGNRWRHECARRNSDLFAERFFNNSCCFFLTTRTSGDLLHIKESELAPLLFLVADELEDLTIEDPVSGKSFNWYQQTSGVYSIDLKKLRIRFAELYGVFPSVFRVWRNYAFSCSILIEEAEPVMERYVIRFHNSFGCVERIEMISDVTVTAEPENQSDLSLIFDSELNQMSQRRAGLDIREKLQLSTGCKRPDELRFVLDMIASDEVWIENYCDYPLRVIPSAENISFKGIQQAPESLIVSFTICDSDATDPDFQTGGIFGSQDRVFSDHFNDKFR